MIKSNFFIFHSISILIQRKIEKKLFLHYLYLNEIKREREREREREEEGERERISHPNYSPLSRQQENSRQDSWRDSRRDCSR